MEFVEVGNRPAVADHVSLEAPLVPQRFLQQCLGTAGRLPVHPVVSAHHAFHFRFLHRGFKGRQIGLGHVLPGGFRVKLVAYRLRAAVHRKVLAAGRGLQILPMSLQALDEADTQTAGQIRILAVGLVSPAPSGIPENIDVRAPYRQPLVDVPIPMAALPVVLGPRLVRDHAADFLLHILVKHGGHADRLRKHRGRAGPGHTVQRFVPPVVGRNPQPRNRRRVILQLGGLLLQGHLPHQRLGLADRFASVSHGLLLFVR